jgi:hypothetical protein
MLKRFNGKRYVGIERGAVSDKASHVSHMGLEACPEGWDDRFHFIYSRNSMPRSAEALAALKRLLAPHGIIGVITTSERAEDAMADIGAWIRAYAEHGLASAYAVVNERESHLVLIHDDWPLKD